MSAARRVRGRRGFTLPELLVVAVLGILLVLALQQTLVGQRRFFTAQSVLAQRQEALLRADAVLGGAFREVEPAAGDAVILAPGRVRVRTPSGLALVCGTDANGSRVGALPVEGAWTASPGDSVTVLLPTGVTAYALRAVEAVSAQVPCVASGAGMVLRLDARVPDVERPSPARAFRSQTFEVGTAGGAAWLMRVDGAVREVVAGPLDGAGGFDAWYEDASGAPVASPASAARIALRVVARGRALPGRSVAPDTLLLRFGGRNR